MIRSIIFDWKRTLYNPDDGTLLPGAKELLEFLQQKGVPMILIGKGDDDMYAEIKRLGVEKYFTEIIFKEGAKENILFRPYITKNPKDTLFIGDRVLSELAVGKSLGATTMWVRWGKFANELPTHKDQEPDYIVESLSAATELLAKI